MNFIFGVSTTIGMTLIPLLTTEGLDLSLLMLGIIEGSSEFLSNMLLIYFYDNSFPYKKPLNPKFLSS